MLQYKHGQLLIDVEKQIIFRFLTLMTFICKINKFKDELTTVQNYSNIMNISFNLAQTENRVEINVTLIKI